MVKFITVFGATGIQGGSVIKAILGDATLAKEYSIRGVTRDTSKPKAQALAQKGVELVTANMDSKDSIVSAIEGSDIIFLVTNYWETGDPEVEKAQGKTVADASKAAGVKHIIFSSLLNVTKISGGRLPHVKHFDGKAEIEEYIRSSGIPATFVLPGYYMSNYLQMLQKGDDGSYSLAYPVSKEAKFPLFDAAEDMGKFVKPALKKPEKFNGKRILAATDYYPVARILAEFEEVTGKKINFNQISADQYKSFLPDYMAQEMLENHLLIEEPGYYNGTSLQESLDALEDKPTTWKEFVKKSGFR
ncbi:NmrA-like family domain-containing protein [Eremomyces bilateralis CBS 781.70]|uniref:NmrA-like family domain-containing protein n=1 Tax=Eremomyces bilateralis CBS 781.70 TaxID=1392243 RepID=A0A6G1GFT2_9PEZI|nr:NmrA-like family domain-containing protein [Eremomyces bilateralis CBS 781.70]KAF1816884.1 NmrA-like family domain-containing protein [Eremomyces bilateralis CBS 781.70]